MLINVWERENEERGGVKEKRARWPERDVTGGVWVNTLTFSDIRGTFLSYGWVTFSISFYIWLYLPKPSISFSLHKLKVFFLLNLIFSSLFVYLFCLSDLFVFSNYISRPSVCQSEAQCMDLSVLKGSLLWCTNQNFFFHLFNHLLLRVEGIPDSASHSRYTLFLMWLLLSSCLESNLSTDKI